MYAVQRREVILERLSNADAPVSASVMAAELGGAEPVLRAAMCAAVFRERGLLDWQLNGDAITLHLRRGQHVALDQSPLMNTLQNDNEKGGGAL